MNDKDPQVAKKRSSSSGQKTNKDVTGNEWLQDRKY